MAKWDHSDPDGCRLKAEARALSYNAMGTVPEHGFLYRLFWEKYDKTVRIVAFPIIKKTAKCWMITPRFAKKSKYVAFGSHKKFAWPTVPEAMASYLARRKAAIRIYEHRLREAELSLAAADPANPIAEAYWLQDEPPRTVKVGDEEIPEEELV